MAIPLQFKELFLSLLPDIPDKKSVEDRCAGFSAGDWRELFYFSWKIGLFPLFFSNACRLHPAGLPAQVTDEFKSLFLFNLKNSLRLEKESVSLLCRLRDDGIAAISLKGAVMARMLHKDPSLRQASCDIDILIRPEDKEKAAQILKGYGFEHRGAGLSPGFFFRFRNSIMFASSESEEDVVNLDLHWGFRDRFLRANLEETWSFAVNADSSGRQVSVPSPEDLLLFLSLSACSDYDFVQLKYIHDLHGLICSFAHSLDWERVWAQAKKYGLGAAVYFALLLSRQVFLSPISEAALEYFRPQRLKLYICGKWLTLDNVLDKREILASSYAWRYPVVSYLLTPHLLAACLLLARRVFISAAEVSSYYGCGSIFRLPFIYLKRLLKPLARRSGSS